MIFINEYFTGIDTTDTTMSSNNTVWTFDIEDEKTPTHQTDFYLKKNVMWQTLTTDGFLLQIGDEGVIKIPHDYHIVIAEYHGGFDCIKPSELMGRDFSALCLPRELEECDSFLSPIKAIGYERMNFIIPIISGIFPVLCNESHVVLVSRKDIYNKIKYITIGGGLIS